MVSSHWDGWVNPVSSQQVLRAVAEGTTVRLETRNGAYIHEGEPLVTLVPAPTDEVTVGRHIGAAVVVSDSQTMQEDVDFALRQLVDIGPRAQSGDQRPDDRGGGDPAPWPLAEQAAGRRPSAGGGGRAPRSCPSSEYDQRTG